MLVGREAEQETIERLLAGARVGDSAVLVIAGDPGIGKSALLTHARSAATGMRVLSARGVEAERQVAFGGLHQVCAPLLDLLDTLPAPQAESLAVALATRRGPTPERFAVGAAVLGLLTRAAEERPLAVLVDDAHLLDESSAQAIAFAARRLLNDPVAVVLALRPLGLTSFETLPTVLLEPLTAEGTRTLVTSTLSEQWAGERLARFHEATGGNPLAILELAGEAERLVAAPAQAPVALTGELLAAYSRRILDLSGPARTVLLLAATDSHDVASLARACAMVGLDLGALAEAESAGLVRLSQDSVEFRHPLVRAAVYGAAEPVARREAHRVVASATAEYDVDRRAWHLAEAAVGPDQAAAALLDQAAADGSRRGANAVASAQLRRSAGLTEDAGVRGRRLLRAGEQAWLAGASAEATALLERSLALAQSPLERSRVRGRLGAIEGRCGSLATARDLQLAAADEAAPHDAEAAALLLADAVESCLYLCDTASALGAAQRLVELTGPAATPAARRLGSLAAGVALVLGGRGDHGADLIRTGMAQPAELGEDGDQWRFRWGLIGPLFLRETGSTRAAMTDVVHIVRTRAAVGMLPFLLTLVARYDAGSTGWGNAEAGYTEAIRMAEESGHDTDRALALGGLAWLQARQGKAGQSRRHGAEAARLGLLHSAHLARLWAGFGAADLESALGGAGSAVRDYEAVQTMLAELGVTDPDLSPAPELVECYAQTGEPERALTTAREFMARAAAKGQPWALARAYRAMGLALVGEEAQEAFLQALALHERTPDPFELARTQLAYGVRLRRLRRRADARPRLSAALTTFEQLGALPWADRAAAELEATGAKAVRRGLGPLVSLTPQERQIANLLAGGRTTREAAMALFLSPKTVEYHLRHIYIKLGIRSREQLARTMAEG